MMYYGGWGHMWWAWLFWIVFIVFAVWLVVRLTTESRNRRGVGTDRESPMDILKKRYARGEITKEQFDSMKKDLSS